MIAQPAATPVRLIAIIPIAAAARPCTAEPAAQAHLRRGNFRKYPAVTSCGSSAPASRTGTSSPISATGAPSEVISQLSTSFGSTSPSALLVSASAPTCLKKLPGSCWQALSGISAHTRPSSSMTIAWKAWSVVDRLAMAGF